ncbi:MULTISPECIES: DUF456 family protein [Paenibacillus]|uniref:DUF456 domain-containing protein n=1 Tax=Paenibacillus TaxID=44249 RepID=UPI00020D666A|nr:MULTISPECIES: DUF456 family protein [Paenibacillus]EGL18458.1 hypothetical protein HMPREF9413_0298 [Paenibacillus sp. HGF7]EPD89683.1 hypothetical protein HMPREF1207_01532 [Paenibacillus sp. HGH0039]MBV6712138.1 DUF456 family protein [Paenibacillus chitinolyticus]
MAILGWILIILLFAVGMLGAIFPILPGALAIFGAFFVYGFFFSFEPFGFWFWLIQSAVVIAITIADYLVSAFGVKKFGGSKASVWGSTIGLLAGPFVIPAFGLILGPFIGAVLGELIHGSNLKHSAQVGVGSVLGFFSSVVVKVVLQLLMIILFIIWI